MGKHPAVLSEPQVCVQSYDRKRLTALAALREAESRTGVKCHSYQRRLESAHVPAGLPSGIPSERTAEFSSAHRAPPVVSSQLETADGFKLQPALAHLFPGGQVAPGSVVSVQGSRALLVGCLAAASQADHWVGLVGMPDLGLLAASLAGVRLERVAIIPAVGADAAADVLAELLPAMWVAVGSGAELRDSERRRLAARARECGSVIFTTEPWPGAHLSFEVTRRYWGGLGRGEGWLQSEQLQVKRVGRASAAVAQTFPVSVPLSYQPCQSYQRDIALPVAQDAGHLPQNHRGQPLAQVA